METQTVVDQTQAVPLGHVFTTKGAVLREALEEKVFVEDHPDAVTTATEYWLHGECVRRDVNVALKPKVLIDFKQQEF